MDSFPRLLDHKASINDFIIEFLQSGSLRADFSEGVVLCNIYYGKPAEWHTMRPFINGSGYIYHRLRYDGGRFRLLAHRVVWMAANGRIPPGLMLDHINRVRMDNRLCNLRLVDPIGNALNSPRRYGEANPGAKLTENQVRDIREAYERKIPLKRLAKRYSISNAQAYNIVSGLCWSGRNRPPRGLPRRRVNNRMLTWNGKTMCQAEWARELGVSAPTIARRANLGLPFAVI